MPSIITFQLGESTATHPFKFFDNFYKEFVLESVRENFFKAYRPQIGFEHLSSHLFEENDADDYFEIEYSREDFDPENPNETFRQWQEVKRFYFKDELHSFLKEKYVKSKELLATRMSSGVKVSNLKQSLKNEVAKIKEHLNFINRDIFFKIYSTECKRPLEALVKDIYEYYPAYAPPAEKEIRDILDGAPVSIDYLPLHLKISLADGIIDFHQDGESIFFKDNDPDDISHLRNKLLNFITGNFDQIDKPINITGNIEAAHYLISTVTKVSTFTLSQIEKKNIITLKGRKFKADTCSKSKSEFLGKNSDLRILIDVLLKEHSE